MNSESHWASKRPIPFVNVSGETIPAFAVMAVRGVSYANGIAFLRCDKPNAAFVRRYAVNNIYDVPPGLRGTCFRAGEARVLYDGGAPAAGEGWGPKPGQWSLAKGYPPTTSVGGIVSADARILLGSLHEIGVLLVKTTAPAFSDTSTVNYVIYGGTFGAETPLAFTTVPPARNRGAQIASGAWALLVWVNNGWELRDADEGRVWHSTAVDDIDAGDTATVELPDTTEVEATNWSDDVDIEQDDKIFLWKDAITDEFFCIKAGAEQPRWFKATLNGTLAFDTDPAPVVTTAALDGGSHPGGVNAANTWSCAGQNGAPCLIVENLGTGGYELVKVKAVKRTVLDSVEWNKPDLEQFPIDIICMDGGDVQVPETILTAQSVDLVDYVDYTKPNLSYTTRTVLVFAEEPSLSPNLILATADVFVTRYVYVSGLNIYQNWGPVTVIAPELFYAPVLVAEGELCVEQESGTQQYTYPAALYGDVFPQAAYADPGAGGLSPAFF